MNVNDLYELYLNSSGVSTDTRSIGKGSIFFALKGPRFNANEFATKALEHGASFAVVDETIYKKDDRYILVADVLTTLQQVALYHRQQLNIPLLAITGSNGKTTTKELLHAVLSKKFNTYATKGNLNNHIGIPLTILDITSDTEIAIIEMGANHQQEISNYCTIALPTHGLITNIGKAHLEGFGGVEGIKKGKGELYDFLLKHNGTVFINSKDEILKSMSHFSEPIWYGNKEDFSYAEFLTADPFIRFKNEEGNTCETRLIGRYNFENINTALCVGKFFGVAVKDASDAVASYDPQNNRSQVIKKGTNVIFLDAYNANPTSMKAALENFDLTKGAKKVVILGDMFELGEDSRDEHREVGNILNAITFELVILCGKEMAAAKNTYPTAAYFADRAELEKWLHNNKIENATILIKGSRGMGLEKLVDLM